MALYLVKFESLHQYLAWYITQVPREENAEKDSLAQLALGLKDDVVDSDLIETLSDPSICANEVMSVDKPTN